MLFLFVVAGIDCKAGENDGKTQLNDQSVTINKEMVKSDAPKNVVIKERKIEKTYHFKTTQSKSVHYGSFTISFSWPESCEDYDLSKLQDALCMGSGSVDEFVNEQCRTMYEEGLWEQVQSVPEGFENYDMLDAPYEMPFPPDGEMYIGRLPYDRNGGFVMYEISGYKHMGCGMGACILQIDTVMMFDVRQNRVVTYEDIFKKDAYKSILQRLKKEHRDDSGEVEEMWMVQRVPQNILFDDKNCSFIFMKYEIDCGAAGRVRLELPISDLKQYMTSYGKSLLGLK